jgi:hypothetical protein
MSPSSEDIICLSMKNEFVIKGHTGPCLNCQAVLNSEPVYFLTSHLS